MILVINPDSTTSASIVKCLRWADGRFQIHIVDDIDSAWSLIRTKKRLNLIICSVHLEATCLAQFLGEVRQALPNAVVLLFSQAADITDKNLTRFSDGILIDPVCRYKIIEYLKLVKARRHLPARPGVLRHRRLPANSHFTGRNSHKNSIKVQVRLAADDFPMTFNIEVPPESRLRTLLKQLGKNQVAWFTLVRNDGEQIATENTVLQDGDAVILKTS